MKSNKHISKLNILKQIYMHLFWYTDWWYSSTSEWKATPISFAGGWAFQGDSSPKILEEKWNLSVFLSYWLFVKPTTSLSLSAKHHHVTLNALPVILICSLICSLNLISISLWFYAVISLLSQCHSNDSHITPDYANKQNQMVGQLLLTVIMLWT